MKKKLLALSPAIVAVVAGTLLLLAPASAQWPGTICKVTNRDDSGVGSYRYCVAQVGNRSTVFEVSGVFFLKSAITIVNPGMRTYCQTAPGPVEFRNAAIAISGAHMKFQHCSVKPGDGPGGVGASNPSSRDAIQVSSYGQVDGSVFDVEVTNNSLEWAIDENASVWGTKTHDVVFANNIIAEPLHQSIHPKGKHSMGLLVNPGGKGVIIARNLLAHNHDRNFRAEEDTQGIAYNNIFYNQGGISPWNGTNFSSAVSKLGPRWDLYNNIWKYGPDTPKLNAPPIYGGPNVPATTKLYVEGNLGGPRITLTQDEWVISGLPESMRVMKPNFPRPADLLPTEEVAAWIEANVGATPWRRSAQDKRIIEEWKTGTGRIKDCVGATYPVGHRDAGKPCSNNAGGWEYIPEVRRALNPPTTEAAFNTWLASYSEGGTPAPLPIPSAIPEVTASPTASPTVAPPVETPTLPPPLPTVSLPAQLYGYIASWKLGNNTICSVQFREPIAADDALAAWVSGMIVVREQATIDRLFSRSFWLPELNATVHITHDHLAKQDEFQKNMASCRDAAKKNPKMPVYVAPPS